MRAVIVHLRDEELADRRSKGLDRWDEMWEGVLHVTPAPSLEHQRIVDELVEFLRPRLRQTGRGRLVSGINVFREATGASDYRIPDLTFVAAGREQILREDGIRGGGPDAVIEIRSPEDETYDKLPFYAALGVGEVIVCHRDTKAPEVFRLTGSRYVAPELNADGWLASNALQVRFRRIEGSPPRLLIADLMDSTATLEI
jgi:Uma2 family endonuclease